MPSRREAGSKQSAARVPPVHRLADLDLAFSPDGLATNTRKAGRSQIRQEFAQFSFISGLTDKAA